MTAKSSVDSVRRDMIAEMRIPLPPLPEQKAIAHILSLMDTAINKNNLLIAKKELQNKLKGLGITHSAVYN